MQPNPDLVRQALDLYQAATDRIIAAAEEVNAASRDRARALALLYDHGHSQRDIAAMVRLSPARVGQMIASLAEKE
jgi:DNA-binding MarR family transcriptional regulator